MYETHTLKDTFKRMAKNQIFVRYHHEIMNCESVSR
ncbi:hypothetical protein M513_13221 [Trichuris suis]|uniref:Uncharacterized protein n=1 Tax=Trichuris suis TaxID=68888 RepID=A0A085LLR3_9BILA|nr:hypothetical protein M513_13221 [Trichuris suis]